MPAADNIKRLRSQRGWSQVRLAMEAHVSQQSISFIERGRNEPSAEMIRALAKALNVSTSEIIDSIPETGKLRTERCYIDSLDPNQERLLSLFDQLNFHGKKAVLSLAENLLQDPDFRQEESSQLAK